MSSGVVSLTRVLVVDDDARLLRSLASSLSRQVQVLTASEPQVAIELVRRHQPDAAIIDLCIGDQRGVDLVLKVRAALPDITIAVLSGFVSAEMSVPGADAVIEKPATADEILQRLGACCRRFAPLAEVIESHIAVVLVAHGGNVSRAARALGLRRTSLQRRLRRKTEG